MFGVFGWHRRFFHPDVEENHAEQSDANDDQGQRSKDIRIFRFNVGLVIAGMHTQ